MQVNLFMRASLISALAFSLVGCGPQGINNQNMGMAAGGVVGGLLGNQIGGGSGRTVATIGGALIGAMIGGNIGQQMDSADQARLQQSINNTPTGRPTSWRNPDNGNRYTVRPTKTYYQGSQPCREFTTTAIIAGKKQQMYGTACRQADGNWKMMSQRDDAMGSPSGYDY